MVMTSQNVASMRAEGTQVCNFVAGTGSIELSLLSVPNFDGRVGLGETVN
jgi:hypothetical protein